MSLDPEFCCNSSLLAANARSNKLPLYHGRSQEECWGKDSVGLSGRQLWAPGGEPIGPSAQQLVKTEKRLGTLKLSLSGRKEG